jgi:hypothetical protein
MNLNLPSPLTQSVPHFPQEIIDKTIDELSSDETTLQQCSTVSRSFHISSRRHLFFFIYLNSIQKTVLFHQLLVRTPDIGRNVQDLCLWPNRGHQEGIIDSAETGNLLSNIFPFLSCIKVFTWLNTPSVRWDKLHSNLQLALVTLFQRPSLTTIDISYVTDFPLSVLHVVSPVKRLTLQSVWLRSSNQSQIILPHLELWRIDSVSQPDDIELLLPNLHQLSIQVARGHQGVDLAEQAINGSTGSLQRICWFSDFKLRQRM